MNSQGGRTCSPTTYHRAWQHNCGISRRAQQHVSFFYAVQTLHQHAPSRQRRNASSRSARRSSQLQNNAATPERNLLVKRRNAGTHQQRALASNAGLGPTAILVPRHRFGISLPPLLRTADRRRTLPYHGVLNRGATFLCLRATTIWTAAPYQRITYLVAAAPGRGDSQIASLTLFLPYSSGYIPAGGAEVL